MRRLAALLVCVVVAGCGSGSADSPRTLTVLAATSLTESFGALEKRFEAEHAGVEVMVSFQASSALAQQIVNGATADVFASADESTMKKVTDAGLAGGTPEIFATNQLTIVVPPGNPKNVTGLADLARDGLIVVVCAPQVPCGTATQKVAKAAGVTLRPRSEEQDVKAVLTKVQLGEVDAGLVYRTDVIAAGDSVTGLPTPQADRVRNDYLIAVLAEAPNPVAAQAFLAHVRSAEGRQVLGAAGFETP